MLKSKGVLKSKNVPAKVSAVDDLIKSATVEDVFIPETSGLGITEDVPPPKPLNPGAVPSKSSIVC